MRPASASSTSRSTSREVTRPVLIAAGLGLSIAALVGCAPAAPPPPDSGPADGAGAADAVPADAILFERPVAVGGGVSKDLFLAAADGSAERTLLDERIPGADVQHAGWSPDGAWVVFEVFDGERADVRIAALDGAPAEVVAACAGAPCLQYAYPRWSPDGTRVAMMRFDRDEAGECCDNALIVRELKRGKGGSWTSGEEREVARFRSADAVAGYDVFQSLAWSPDGRSIAYTIDEYALEDPYPLVGGRIDVVDVESGEVRRLTPPELVAGDPDWDACTGAISFTTYPLSSWQQTAEPSNIHLVQPDGSGLRRLTEGSVDGALRYGGGSWLPDGSGMLTTIGRASGGTRLDGIELAAVSPDDGTVAGLGVVGTAARARPQPGSCPAAD